MIYKVHGGIKNELLCGTRYKRASASHNPLRSPRPCPPADAASRANLHPLRLKKSLILAQPITSETKTNVQLSL
jgi:hypothetical protein